jgi:hypothetical protein
LSREPLTALTEREERDLRQIWQAGSQAPDRSSRDLFNAAPPAPSLLAYSADSHIDRTHHSSESAIARENSQTRTEETLSSRPRARGDRTHARATRLLTLLVRKHRKRVRASHAQHVTHVVERLEHLTRRHVHVSSALKLAHAHSRARHAQRRTTTDRRALRERARATRDHTWSSPRSHRCQPPWRLPRHHADARAARHCCNRAPRRRTRRRSPRRPPTLPRATARVAHSSRRHAASRQRALASHRQFATRGETRQNCVHSVRRGATHTQRHTHLNKQPPMTLGATKMCGSGAQLDATSRRCSSKAALETLPRWIASRMLCGRKLRRSHIPLPRTPLTS